MKWTLLLSLLLVSTPSFAQKQNRVQLDDVNIDGEASRNQTLFSNRDRFGLDDRIQIRKNFRPELEEAIPPSLQKLSKDELKEPALSSAPQ